MVFSLTYTRRVLKMPNGNLIRPCVLDFLFPRPWVIRACSNTALAIYVRSTLVRKIRMSRSHQNRLKQSMQLPLNFSLTCFDIWESEMNGSMSCKKLELVEKLSRVFQISTQTVWQSNVFDWILREPIRDPFARTLKSIRIYKYPLAHARAATKLRGICASSDHCCCCC